MIGLEMPTKPRRPVIVEKPSARPRTEAVNVASPTVSGATDHVQRVIDPLMAMFKRRQIGERDYMAGDRYRLAYETLYGATGGVGDYERSRGGSLPGQPPAPSYLVAADLVSEVRHFLYPKDYAVVYRICVLGLTIKEASEQLYQDRPTRAQEEDCGRRLREGLSQLADRWFPARAGAGSKIRAHVEERAMAGDTDAVPRSGGVVHATRDRIYKTGK